MTSPAPLLYDTYYHIYNRGNNRENIFVQERNYEYFLGLYERHVGPITDTFAYCLLRNHFHLLVRVKSEEEIAAALRATRAAMQASGADKPLGSNYPSKRFSDLFNAYAKAINKAHGRTGSLFQHPFGRVPVTSDQQFWNVIAYIHRNPQKHGLTDDFRDWKWSSYGRILGDEATNLQRGAVLEWFGGREQYLELHAHWMAGMQTDWLAQDDED